MFGLGESFIAAFAIFLRASPIQVGVLATLPPLLGAASQLLGVRLMEVFPSRRYLIVRLVNAQALIWFPIALLPWIFDDRSGAVTALIVLTTLYFVLGNISTPIWNSLIGDLVPPEMRGRYFGFRNSRGGFALITAVIAAGLFLEVFRGRGHEAIAYLILFILAGMARLRSAYWLARYDDPELIIASEDRFSLWDFLRRLPHSNFARFTLFYSLMNCVVSIAGPYFSLYMIRSLNLDYVTFTTLLLAQLSVQFLAMRRWGMLADLFGSRRLLGATSAAITILPALWLVSDSVLWLVGVQILAGLAWAGYNLASFNFLLDAVTPPKRARCTAYMGVLNGVFVFLGAMVGALLLGDNPGAGRFIIQGIDTPPSPYLDLFLISAVLRCCVVFGFFRLFHEVRDVASISTAHLVFHVTNLKFIGIAALQLAAFATRRRGHPPEEKK
jgi:MFS family permease